MITKASLLILIMWMFSCKTPLQIPPPEDVKPDIPIETISVPAPTKKTKNVILLIGGGMGLPQITTGMYLNGNKTALEKFPIVGIQKSHSSNNLVTDSAAGATAFACGVKTYSGAIAVDVDGNPVRTILEEAEQQGWATGLVATSTIVHATPAAFIAHNQSRRNYEAIALDFLKTDIDLFIGGGKQFFTRRQDERDLVTELKAKGYYMSDFVTEEIDSVVIPNGMNFGYLTSENDPLQVISGRDYLIPASKLSLEFLDGRSKEGFFLMIEGSQIDWGRHANDLEYVVSEFRVYDQVINMAYEFARKNKETLVIVTTDHETGGLTIKAESTMGSINASFSAGGHTAVMIPVFAYGPGAETFSGIYDNTAIYSKLKSAMGLN